MKRTIVWVIIAIFALSACAAQDGTEQGGTTTGTTQTVSTTMQTTGTVLTTVTTNSTTIPTEPTTVTTVSTTVSTTQTTTTKPTTTTTKPTTVTTKPTTVTTKPPTIITISTTQLPEGVLYRGNRFTVYQENENYLIEVISGGEVEFAPDRTIVRKRSLEPIHCDDYKEFLNYNFDHVKSILGQPHFEEGSGFYIPSYVTDDAHVMFLYVTNGRVDTIVLSDITMNEESKVWSIYDE